MSSTKAVLILFGIIMAGLIAGISYMSLHRQQSVLTQKQTTQQNPPSTNSLQVSPPVTQSGTNDQQLEKDSQSMNDDLGTVNSELQNIDQGLYDQPANLQ